jgi:glucosyl-3-phosphoglycerate synthase
VLEHPVDPAAREGPVGEGQRQRVAAAHPDAPGRGPRQHDRRRVEADHPVGAQGRGVGARAAADVEDRPLPRPGPGPGVGEQPVGVLLVGLDRRPGVEQLLPVGRFLGIGAGVDVRVAERHAPIMAASGGSRRGRGPAPLASAAVPSPRRLSAAAFPVGAFAGRRRSVSLVIPALDEAEAIAATVAAGRRLRDQGVVDAVLVVDGGSTDATGARAEAAGATVVDAGKVHPEVGPVLGKGDVLWRSLDVVDTDVVVFLDADLRGDLEAFVRGLAGPLVAVDVAAADDEDEQPAFVKGAFHRLAPDGADPADPFDGGRVTELMARPLLNLWRPDLAAFYQPLGGQVAGTTELLTAIPLLTGYAVEIAMLVDVVDRVGLDRVAEVELGTLRNRPRPTAALAPMAQEVLYGFARRVLPPEVVPGWRPYVRPGQSLPPTTVVERPPIRRL